MAPNMDMRKTVVGGRRIRSIVVGLGMTLVLGAPVAAWTSCVSWTAMTTSGGEPHPWTPSSPHFGPPDGPFRDA